MSCNAGFVLHGPTSKCVKNTCSTGLVLDTYTLMCETPESCSFDTDAKICGWTHSRYWKRANRQMDRYTGPAKAQSGSYFMSVYSLGSAMGTTSYLVSPKLSASAKSMTFYYHMYGANMGTLAVQVRVGSTWQGVWSRSGQQQRQWRSSWAVASVAIPSVAEQVRFKGVRGGGSRTEMTVDAVEISNLPSSSPQPPTRASYSPRRN